MDKYMLKQINKLAELESTDIEAEKDINGLEETIGYFNCISGVDTTGVKPLIQPFENDDVPLRKDTPVSGEDVLHQNAPLMRDGMVVTPRSI